jgi:hypothetical protein
MGASVSEVVQAVLFALFASLTGILWAVTLPTYNDLLVPELLPGAAYPPLFGPGSGASSSFLTLASPPRSSTSPGRRTRSWPGSTAVRGSRGGT